MRIVQIAEFSDSAGADHLFGREVLASGTASSPLPRLEPLTLVTPEQQAADMPELLLISTRYECRSGSSLVPAQGAAPGKDAVPQVPTVFEVTTLFVAISRDWLRVKDSEIVRRLLGERVLSPPPDTQRYGAAWSAVTLLSGTDEPPPSSSSTAPAAEPITAAELITLPVPLQSAIKCAAHFLQPRRLLAACLERPWEGGACH